MASWLQFTDDIGLRVELERPPKHVVSLVPSWTQTLFALDAGEMLVAATRFCVEPAEALATIPKIGGTKNPNLREIAKLKPDLVIANAEENRREDIERLREQGVPVLTTYPRTVPGAVESILRMGRALDRSQSAESRPGSAYGASFGFASSARFGRNPG
jgi:ABC-type Fe3+-hydroxamate transport system substrate-binding protein